MGERIVHCVWTGLQPLSCMERLCLALWLRLGAKPWVWTYHPGSLHPLPVGAFCKDAREIMTEESIFRFRGGHDDGSLAHWRDVFACKALQKYGGWASQLDVAPLALPDPEPDYFFFPMGDGVQTCVVRCPPGKTFLEHVIAEMETLAPAVQDGKADWNCNLHALTRAVSAAGLYKYRASPHECLDGGGTALVGSRKRPPAGTQFIHWGASYCKRWKANPLPGSFYRELLEGEGLLPRQELRPIDKVLLVAGDWNDVALAGLAYGLVALLPRRVFQARPHSAWLGRRWVLPPDAAGRHDFDLVIVSSDLDRHSDFHWVHGHLKNLKPGGKIAYVECWDDAEKVVKPRAPEGLPFPLDLAFRRELDPERDYPYPCLPLGFSLPETEFYHAGDNRPLDVVWAAETRGDYGRRRPYLEEFLKAPRPWYSRAVVDGLHYPEYLTTLRRAKFCVCPSGVGRGDCQRTLEAASQGAIPVFCDYTPRERGVWFGDDVSFSCSAPEELPWLLREALRTVDLAAMRTKLREHCLAHHTTAVRAREFLAALGFCVGEGC